MTLSENIQSRFPQDVLSLADQAGDEAIYLKRDAVKKFFLVLKEDAEFQFDMLADLFAVDYLFWEEKENRFEIVYNLYSTIKNHRIFIKVQVPEKDARVESVTSVWPAANWFEREVWDMFGVKFDGHPNLKRILMYEEFQGHALRKDYPYNKRQPLIGPLN
jgi:NADH-quinone oxidoreductase subunit C